MNKLHNPRKGRSKGNNKNDHSGEHEKERSKQAQPPPIKIIWLLQVLLLKIPTGHMNEHHDEIETDISEFGGMVLSSLR